jgi:hypothetical protein
VEAFPEAEDLQAEAALPGVGKKIVRELFKIKRRR